MRIVYILRLCDLSEINYETHLISGQLTTIWNQLRDPFNMVVSCPEFQDTEAKRIEAKCKGYIRGCPDIVICTPNKEYNGFALEFKNPNGSGQLSDSQKSVLQRFEDDGYKVLVSNDLLEIVYQLTKYKFQMNN